MSRRNPKTGRRSRVKPGDRVIFTLPPGPPAAAIEQFGGDVQAAVTAALTLLALMSASGLAPPSLPSAPPPPPEPPAPSDSLPAHVRSVIAQPLF